MPRSSSSSTRRSSATRPACTSGWPSPSPRTSSRRSCSSTKCSRSATPPSRRSAWARWARWPARRPHRPLRQPQHGRRAGALQPRRAPAFGPDAALWGVDEVVSTYHAETSWVDGSLTARRDRQGDQRLRTSHLHIYPARGHPGDAVCSGDDTVFELHYENLSGQRSAQPRGHGRHLRLPWPCHDFSGERPCGREDRHGDVGWELPVRSAEAPPHPGPVHRQHPA